MSLGLLSRRRATAIKGGGGGELPAGYTQYDWVENTSATRDSSVDAELAPNGATWKFDGSFARTQNFGSNYTYYGLFGRLDIANNARNFAIYRGFKDYNKIVYNYNSAINAERNCGFYSKTVSIGKWYEFSLHATSGVTYGGTLEIDGEGESFTYPSTAASSTGHLFLLLGYVCRFARLKIYDNDVLVADLVPAKRDADNVVGFYDVVRENFYAPSSEGTPLLCGYGFEDFTV